MLQPFLDDPFAAALTEYFAPIRLPDVEPTFEPVSVMIACQWLPYVIGACKAMLQEAAWDTTDPVALSTVLGQVQDLLFIMSDAQHSGCGAEGVPFACPGDASFSSSPYGTWAIRDGLGSYTPGLGYVSTQSLTGGAYRTGVELTITLPSLVAINDIDVTYTRVCGLSDAGGDICAQIFDLTNAERPEPPQLFTDCSSGAFQHFHSGALPALCEQFLVEILCDRNVAAVPPSGSVIIHSVRITGATPPGNTAPC